MTEDSQKTCPAAKREHSQKTCPAAKREPMEIKQYLYAWCGKRKLNRVFEYSTAGPKHGPRFKCEVRIESFDYIGVGHSTNKKDSQTNAVRDFVEYLVREGIVTQADVSMLTVGIGDWTPMGKLSSEVSEDGMGNSGISPSGNIPADTEDPQKSNLDRPGAKRKLKESEDLELNAGIHGNWTLENAKSRLHQFLQQNKIQADYKYSMIGPDHNRSFLAEMNIYVESICQHVSAREQGSNKQVASKSCSLSMVRQLYDLGLIKSYRGPNNQNDADQIHLHEIAVSPELEESLDETLKAWNINSIQVPISCKEVVSLVTHTQLDELDPAPKCTQPGIVSWCPPQPNWNPWKNCNIDEGPMANATTEQISKNVRQSLEEHKANNKELQTMLDDRSMLPIHNSRDHIIHCIKTSPVVLIRGETGCGKSTQVPQFILDDMIAEGKGADCNIIVTQPKRMSAISVAERVAMERDENIGLSTGYSVRFESVLPRPHAAILYCTLRTLLRRLENGLRGVSHVIVDEIHERDINTDFLLILLRDMLSTYSELRVVLMSATVDVKLFSEYFGNCTVVEVNGRGYPVQDYFLEDCIQMTNFFPPPNDRPKKEDDRDNEEENCNLMVSGDYSEATRRAMAMLNEKEMSFDLIDSLLRYIKGLNIPGAVLIFLPGWNLIFALQKHFEMSPEFGSSKYQILPLHSQLPSENQKKVFEPVPDGIMKIILSTNIAETSVTINDVVYVIDSCKDNMKLFTPHNNTKNYATLWVSKTSFEQRRGRAGRVRPGFCFRFCSRARYERLEQHTTPEISRTPLHELSLAVKLLRLGSIGHFFAKAVEPPPMDAIAKAETRLKELHALDENDELTPLGRILARLPIEPRLGKMMIYGCAFSCGDAVCTIAACTAFPEPVTTSNRKRLGWVHKDLAGTRSSDHVALLNVFQRWEHARKLGEDSEASFCETKSLSMTILRKICEAKNLLRDILINSGLPNESMLPKVYNYTGPDGNLDIVTTLLCIGFYPNIFYNKEKCKVLTAESKEHPVDESSVNCSNFKMHFSSPYFILGEKYFFQVGTRAVSCKEMTMVTPLQLLLFASLSVVYRGGLVILDDWIKLKIKPNLASKIVALRPAMEALIVRTTQNPAVITDPSQQESALMNGVRMLSQPNAGRFGIADQIDGPPKKKFARFFGGGDRGSY